MDTGSPIHPAISAFYEAGREAARTDVASRLEWERTQDILERHLPRGTRVLDVGGGPGRHAVWLKDHGFEVELIDPFPLHVEQASAASDGAFVAEVGDARAIDRPSASFDVVLMLGPLYHLVEATDRATALREALRVLKPGGLLVAAAIGRFAWVVDATSSGLIDDPAVRARALRSVETGLSNEAPQAEDFYAYFHRPHQLRRELGEVGFTHIELLAVEGFAHALADLQDRLDVDHRRMALFEVLRAIEADDDVLGISNHIVAIARTPIGV